MKINKNIVQHAFTAIVSAGLAIGSSLILLKPSTSFSFANSGRITLIKSDSLRADFVKNESLKVTHKGRNGDQKETTERLQGFVFNVSDLEEIIHNNRSKDTADEVFFYFGRDGKTGPVLNRHGLIHIIAIGSKNDTLLLQDADQRRNEPSIFDKADPCPPFCGTIKTE